MKTMALKLITFLAVIASTQSSLANDEMNKFDLKDYGTVDQMIDSVTDKDFKEMSEDDDVAYRAFVTRQLLNGERVEGICGLADTVTCEEQLKMLSGNGKLREILNRGKGEYVRLRTTPQAGAYQIQNLYSIRPIKDEKGLSLYVAVSGDGYRRAGLLDYARQLDIVGDSTKHKAVQGGVIYLLRFR